MKNQTKYILQRILGLPTYLYVFALFKIRTLRWDKKENDFFTFLSLLKDDKGAVLDIGANLGIMTVHLAKQLPNTVIHAFEPMPVNKQVLKRIIAKFNLSKVQLYEVALGAETGTVEMVLPVNGTTIMQGLSHVKHDSITEWNEGQVVQVPLEKLDSIIGNVPVQGIKIDVENYEYFALKGGEQLLANQRPIIYAELWDNDNRKQCFELLKQYNYQVFVVEKQTLVPFNPTAHRTQNFIFIAEA